MEAFSVKNVLAPCGLNCSKCYAFTGGDIQQLSSRLRTALGNFDRYAERFVELTGGDIFKKYPDFKEMLAYFASGDCNGCRNEECKIFKDCKVRECAEQKNLDFCYQCEEFPCNHTGFDEHLQARYIAINKRMKEIGAAGYYEEVKDKPRY